MKGFTDKFADNFLHSLMCEETEKFLIIHITKVREYIEELQAKNERLKQELDKAKDWSKAKWQSIELASKEINSLRDKNRSLDDALALAHTELTENPDWPDTEHQHFISETIEQALKGGE